MKNNKIKFLIYFFFLNLVILCPAKAIDPFEFEANYLEVLDNGNIIKGNQNGKAITDNGKIIIEAQNFEYDKTLQILKASGDVKIIDLEKDFTLHAPNINYLKSQNKIYTIGLTKINIQQKYDFSSEDVFLDRDKMELSSSKKSKIVDSSNTLYEIDKFKFLINSKVLKGTNVTVKENLGLSKDNSDNYFFKDGIFNLEKKTFKASDTKIELKKNIFDNLDNDPRIFGVSSSKSDNLTIIEKGVFTSCSKNEKCPPWSVKADKIIHNKTKKQLIYEKAIMKIYDFPIMYFPKFFHPDPTVERQSGFLQPRLNNSNVLGSSITTPYFHVLTENQDVTLKPTLFDQDIQMLQAEYRQENKKSSFIGDFSFVNNFKSSISKTKNSITHLFSKFFIDLDFDNYEKSKVEIFVEKVSNDSYLNIFDSILLDTPLKPINSDKLTSGFNLYLNNNNFNLDLGFTVYENLGLSKSDKYQYVLPFYNFTKNLYSGNFGSINLLSNGSNDLNSTNKIDSYVVNDLQYFSNNKILDNFGLVSNFEIYLKNINSIGKKSDKYKSKPKIEMSNLYLFNTSMPLIKNTLNETQIFTPKISFRINPSDMLNYKNEDRNINNSNIFASNRLGLNDTFEGGKSLTVGVDFNSKKIENENNYYNLSLATVLRDSEEQNIPNSSTLNNKNSNLFGTMEYNFSEFMNLNYAFSLDNNFNTFESNNIGLDFKFNNFGTSVNFIEESGNIGNTNILENSFFYELNEKNSLNFKTRRNRTINLTEYYDLVYEYNNDCLTAAMKYKKTYYQNNAIKPTEDLMFTLTIYPITTLEQKVDSNLYRN